MECCSNQNRGNDYNASYFGYGTAAMRLPVVGVEALKEKRKVPSGLTKCATSFCMPITKSDKGQCEVPDADFIAWR